jgi:hypothetical protein
VKFLSNELAGRDQTIRKKDEEIAALKKEIEQAKEGAKQTSDATQVQTGELSKQLDAKTTEAATLQQELDKAREERDDLASRLKTEQHAAEMVEEGEEAEQVKITVGLWRTNNTMIVMSSDNILPEHKIDLNKDLDLDMNKGVFVADVMASGRFGFSISYSEMTFSGHSIMPADRNFYGATFDSGHAVDSEFYVQQASLGLQANLGAIHKSPTRRIDLGLLLGGRYFRVSGRMYDRVDEDRASDKLDAPIPSIGLRLRARYRDGFYWLLEGRAMAYNYGEFNLRNFIEAKAAVGFNIMRSLDIELGYAYSNTNFMWEDNDTSEKFLAKLSSEGPYFSFVLSF